MPSVSDRPSVSADPTTFIRLEQDLNGEVIYLPECPPEGCGVCTGDCKTDADCAENLMCWRAEEDRGWDSKLPVPGCDGGQSDSNHRWGHIGYSSYGYCFDPWNNQTYPEQVPPTQTEWEAEEFYFNHDNDAPCCQIFSPFPATQDINVTVPISGSTNISSGSPTYMNTTYIYVIDVSGSTKVDEGNCGDQTGEGWVGDILDCEVLSLEYANDDAIASGQVDLVGLVNFSTTGAIMSDLIEPWKKSNLQRRDEDIIDVLREVYPDAFTNFSAGVELACDLAESPANDNQNTVVIFLSDGLPNRGNSSQTRIQNACNNAIFRTYAITEDASCYKVDPSIYNDDGSNPDTLAKIATYSGGTCEYIPVVSELPEALKRIASTKVLSVHVEVNGVVWDGVDLTYTLDPPFTGPNATDYTGTIDLPVGVHQVCFISTSEITGVLDRQEVCQQIVVMGIDMSPDQTVTTSGPTSFNLTTTLIAPGGTIEPCCDATAFPMTCTTTGGGPNDGMVASTLSNPNDPFSFLLENDGTATGTDIVTCCANMTTGETCGLSEISWQDSPSTTPTDMPSLMPSESQTPSTTAATDAPTNVPTTSPTQAPTLSPTASPTQVPTTSPTGTPTASPTTSPTGTPTTAAPTMPDATNAPSRSPTASPTATPTASPTASPIATPTASPTASPTGTPTVPPTASPTGTAATPAPTSSPTREVRTSLDVFPMSCNYLALPPNTCSSDPQPACRPLRFPAYCPPEESFLDLISARHDYYTADDGAATETDGYWYHELENKLATKMVLNDAGYNVAALYYCSTDMSNGLADFTPPVSNSFVVKAMGMHSDAGVYVLPNGFGGTELLTGQTMTMADVQNALAATGAAEFIVEEYVGDPVAMGDEYKFHMFNGTVGSIIYATNRGTECQCFAELDADWNRIDTNGCVRPGGFTQFQPGSTCPAMDTARGLTVQMKGLDLCSNAPPPDPILLDSLTTTAQAVSEFVGVYMRVDMSVDAAGNVVVGELTPNHTNGRVHCAVMYDSLAGCNNPCALGNLWSQNSGTSPLHGGDATPIPTPLTTVGTDFVDMCNALIAP
uniref:VWFA domain-containing protein n=1 Tax=Grammatophora oceanica TaxID=210454 RepID=A0A7S1YG75_9STRA